MKGTKGDLNRKDKARAMGEQMAKALSQPEPSPLPFTPSGWMEPQERAAYPKLLEFMRDNTGVTDLMEPFIVLPCWIMVQVKEGVNDWIARNLRILPSQVEQYYEGGIHVDSTCLVLKSGNIAICSYCIDDYERAIAQYYEYRKGPITKLTFKPTL